MREGWDNPNVFQICTLNESHSAMKKRQEIGRGLRLCVNQNGERVMDKKVNVLTVVPNESYDAFAKRLQQEIEEETGVKFEKRINNARAKARVTWKTLTPEENALFQAIWDKINYQTRYSVTLETPELIAQCVALLRNKTQYPPVQRPKVKSEKGLLHIDQHGVQSVLVASGGSEVRSYYPVVPDVYAYLQSRLHLSRETLFAILSGSGRLDELLLNPQAFLDMTSAAIQNVLNGMLVSGIEYHELEGQHYEMSLLQEVSEAYLSGLFPHGAESELHLDKTLLQAQALGDRGEVVGEPFECVVTQSNPEVEFASDCQARPEVRFFFKLPRHFKIDTPLGTYNPDWAVVFENDKQIYFVVETKSTLVEAERRPNENLKIHCGQRHFALRKDVTFKVATRLGEVV